MSSPPLLGQTALITGGASGLGLGCAQRLAALGASLIIVDRNAQAWPAAEARLQTVLCQGATLRFEPLDLLDGAAISRFCAQLTAREPALHLLINNAGIYPPAQRTLSAEGQELSLAIGHLGHFRLTLGLLPLLERAAAAKVVSIASLAQRQGQIALDDLSLAQGYTPIRAYRQTKLACLLFAQGLQERLAQRGSPVQSFAAHPGVVSTSLGSNRPRQPSDAWWQRFNAWLLGVLMERVGLSPSQGAEAVVQIAQGRWPAGSFVGPKGWLEMFGPMGLAATGPGARQAGVADALWAATEGLTQMRWPESPRSSQ